ncbi:EAL domain-containing protein [Klebsiella pneumoniae subsp. pneumoniae]|nr:EAL domain-containing protein [Klebsiella pneumoniae subsp. pneumoniae]
MVISSQPLPAKVWQRIKDPYVDMLTLDNTVYRISAIPELGSGIVTWSSDLPLQQRIRQQLFFLAPCRHFHQPARHLAAAASLPRHLRSPRNSMLDALNSKRFRFTISRLFRCRTGKIAGAEALARWRAARWHFFIAGYLYSLAEQTGLITQLTEDIVRKIFTDLGPWPAAAAGSAHIHQPVGR